MGRGCSWFLHALASVVAVVEIECGFSVASSEQTRVCATPKEVAMRGQCTVISKITGVTISIAAKCAFQVRWMVLAAALLMFGWGDVLSPSALAYSVC